MKYRYILSFLFLFLFAAGPSLAQLTTPGANLTLTLTDLQGEAVSHIDGVYYINQPVIIAATDKLNILTDETVRFAAGTYLEIQGELEINPPNSVVFTPQNMTDGFHGVHINSSPNTVVKKLTLEYAVSFKISYASPLIEACQFRNNNHLSSTTFGNGAIAIGFSSQPVIRNSIFLNNKRAAIQSGTNAGSAPQIIGNHFEGNNTTNTNVPHINLGSSGGDTTRIIGNKIINAGSVRAGGISITGLGVANVIISANEIRNNRYGINLTGGSDLFTIVSDNVIDSNNIEGNPLLGGSGIAYSGGTAASRQVSIVKRNTFTANLWGITIQGAANPNMGNLLNTDTTDDGANRFINNTNSATPGIDLYNNTPYDIMAQGNYWNTTDPEQVRQRIFDSHFDESLGTVNFSQALLPVQLASFNARIIANDVVLSWQTESESNSSYFDILKSEDGRTFSTIGEVQAAGNSQLPLRYSFTDPSAAHAGSRYYQLRMVDKDGSSARSQVVRISANSGTTGVQVKVYPTVIQGPLTLRAEMRSETEQTVQVRLLSSQGALLHHFGTFTLRKGENTIRLEKDVSAATGILYLHISGAGIEHTQPLLKQ